jgi:carbon-monoxide dehydrogenase medium subunit
VRDFAYRRPATLEEARRLALEAGAMLLAGGQTLLRDMKLGRHAPQSLVDLADVVPKQIALHESALSVGAGATHAEVAAAPVLRGHLPVLAALVGQIGDPAVRHRGTLGGALAANEPAGDYPAACLGLGAVVQTTTRDVDADRFFVRDRGTALEPGEIVIAASFPIPRQAAYIKFLNPAARYAMVGVFAARLADGSPRVAITGARSRGAFRWRDAERALLAEFTPEALKDVHLSREGLLEDLFADAAYRAHLAEVLTRRAVALAARRPGAVVVLSHGTAQE